VGRPPLAARKRYRRIVESIDRPGNGQGKGRGLARTAERGVIERAGSPDSSTQAAGLAVLGVKSFLKWSSTEYQPRILLPGGLGIGGSEMLFPILSYPFALQI